MLVIGLTGSIGMGKSAAAKQFRDRGVPVCDADALVHELYEGEAVAPIEAAFPGTTSKGRVDRVKLSASLMIEPAGFKRLEAIVHPLVNEAERECLAAAALSGARMAVLEVPLLLEGDNWRRCDVIVVVSAPTEVQRQRVLARPGMTPAKLDAILTRQMPDAEKRRRADYVVDTGGDMQQTLDQVDQIVATLAGREGTAYRQHWS